MPVFFSSIADGSSVSLMSNKDKKNDNQNSIQAAGIAPISQNVDYGYDGETLINPGYQDSESIKAPLKAGEKRMWVLREDFILATGIKNAYQAEFSYNEFTTAFVDDLDLSLELAKLSRYGHPSLTFNEYDHKVGVFYAGYVSQSDNQLTVFLASGRYFRNDLSTQQVAIMESYVAVLFQKAYGNQRVVFYHGLKRWQEYDNKADYYQCLGLFFNEKTSAAVQTLDNEPHRHYLPSNSFSL